MLLNRHLVAWAASVVVLAGVAGCKREPPRSPRQAIFLLLDAARPDRFSCYGYGRDTTPEMDRLAEGGVVFRRHYAQGTSTRPSVSSLMYSRFFCLPLFPNSPHVPYSNPSNLFRRPDDAQVSLVKALRAAGFKTAAISAHKWTGERTAFAAEFDEMHDLTTRFEKGDTPYPRADKVIDYTIDWVRKNADRDYFLYVHLMDTHYPHLFGPEARKFFGASSYDARHFRPGGEVQVPDAELTDDDRRYVNALYDGSLRYTDRQIGRLAEFLRKKKLLDTTVIAITADHGEHLLDQPGERTREGVLVFGHGGVWLEPVARIPLIIHYPRALSPRKFDGFSEGVDVGPTLLGLLNVALPSGKEFDGVDLVQVLKGSIPPKGEVVTRRAIRTDRYKCLFGERDDVLLRETAPDPSTLSGQLYDLVEDPAETINLFPSRPDVVGELLKRYRARLTARYRRYEAARSSEQPRAAFAVSVRHMKTDVELPKVSGTELPEGWCRFKRGGYDFIVATKTNEPLNVRFPLPNGRYELAFKMQGFAVIEVGNQSYEHNKGTSIEFGEITVTDEVFRATIRPRGDQTVVFSYFGFTPPAAVVKNPDEAREQLERLRALGYVD